MGDKQISDLIGDDLELSIIGNKVTVTGTIKNVTKAWKEFDSSNNTGHFLPIQLPAECKNQKVIIKGRTNGDRTVTITDDLLLISRLENFSGTSFIIEKDGKTLLNINFANTIPTGAEAIDQPDYSKDYGRYGKANEYFEDGLAIKWNGNIGKVTGTLLMYNNTETNEMNKIPGHYLPVTMTDWYDGVSKLIKGENEKTVPDRDIIFTVKDKATPFIFKYNGLEIARLDLSNVELKES